LLAAKAFGYGDTAWLRTYDPSASTGEARFIAVGPDNNIISGGWYNGGGFQVVKYAPAGDTVWASKWNDTMGGPNPQAMAVDRNGDVVMTGYSMYPTENRDGGITVLCSADGQFQWHAYWRGPHDFAVWLLDVAFDQDGNVYACGWREDSLNQQDMFLVKYNHAGVEQWWRKYDSDTIHHNPDIGEHIAIDGLGNIHVLGYSEFWPSSANTMMTWEYSAAGDLVRADSFHAPNGGSILPCDLALDYEGNIIVFAAAIGGLLTIKFAPSGAEEWHRFYLDSTGLGAVPAALALDDSGNVYFTASDVNSGQNQYDFVTGKYRPNGDTVWSVRYDGQHWSDRPSDIAVDKFGSVYVTGFSDDSASAQTLATVKYDRNGVLQWAVRTFRGYDVGTELALDSTGGIYVAGYSGLYSHRTYTVVKYREYNLDHDVGVVRVTAPHGTIPQGTVVTPACSTYNFGTYPESYRVRMNIGAGYEDTAFVTNQQPGTASYVTFPNWTAGPVGRLAVIARTELGSDSNPANDVWIDSVTVGNPGVEERGTPDVGRTVPVQTIVRGVLYLPGGSDFPVAKGRGSETSPTFLLDITGRKVIELHPGLNDVSRFGSGVYFLCLASGAGRNASSVSKVVIAR
jgi:hypothetical protein